MWSRPLRFILGLLLVPVFGLLAVGFASAFRAPGAWSRPAIALLAGFGAYLVVHFAMYRPVFLHVVGHELTHALASALMGGRVKALQVTPAGGAVLVSKSNVVVALAPYFLPIWTGVAVGVFAVAAGWFRPVAAALVGATLSFHLALTATTLKKHQPDLEEAGIVLSLALIAIANLVTVAAILALVAPELFSFREFLAGAWRAVGAVAGGAR